MIKIVLSDWPDKHSVRPEKISDVIDAHPSDLYFITEITTAGNDEEFDIDVYIKEGAARVLVPDLSHRVACLDDVLAVLWDYDNGGADEFLRALAVPRSIITSAWDSHHKRTYQPPTV